MRKKVKLSKQVPVIDSFFILALIYQLEKKWEENTRLQDEKKRSEILIQDLLENLQPLESEEQESTPMSNCRSPSEEDVASKQVVYLLGLNPGRFVPEMLMGADYLHLYLIIGDHSGTTTSTTTSTTPSTLPCTNPVTPLVPYNIIQGGFFK